MDPPSPRLRARAPLSPGIPPSPSKRRMAPSRPGTPARTHAPGPSTPTATNVTAHIRPRLETSPLKGSKSMPRLRPDPRAGLGRRSDQGVDIDLDPVADVLSRPGTSTGHRRAQAKDCVPGNKDKVVVCVRAKPTADPSHAAPFYELDAGAATLELSDLHPNVKKRGGKAGREAEYRFSFDELHLPPLLTSSLYEGHIAPLVDAAMQGFNSTIFAYGQTGSGKTHTMSGTPEEQGVIPLAVAGVFEAIEGNPTRNYLLRVSYLEIYNEQIRDLLQSSKKPLTDAEKPNIHVENGQVVVRPLVEEIVRMPEEIMAVLKRGERNRKTAGTDWNERSSRSHAVFTITIESGDGVDTRRSRLTLIDLAGSEKAASNIERLSEGKYINKSLLALGTVIETLADKTRKAGSHIPYRNSKLTHLLENAIGGNANIAVICTLSVEDHHASETLETLKFANRCAQVETKAVKGIIPASEKAMLKAKEEEIAQLKMQLEALNDQRKQEIISRSPVQRHELNDELEELEGRRDRLFAQLSTLNGEILSSRNIGSNYQSGESSAARNRRRVSDFSRGRIGLGQDLVRTAMTPRRAMSGAFPATISEAGQTPRTSSIEGDLLRVAVESNRADKEATNSLQAENDALHSELEALRKEREEHDQLKRRFGDESAKRAELQRLHEGQREALAALEAELAVANETASSLRREVDELRALKPAKPMVDATKRRLGLPVAVEISVPGPEALRHSGSLKEYRRILEPDMAAPYTPAARAMSREREEIERLHVVIEGLTTVQGELLSKISGWKETITRQDELIRSLAQEDEPVMLPKKATTTAGTERTAFILSPSMAANSPSTPPRQLHKSHSRNGSTASYFGASPPPLPIAPSMVSNTSARKGRRITVEHELGKLSQGNKVDRARAMFGAINAPPVTRQSPRTDI